MHATFRPGEGREAVSLLETLGLDIEDYKLLESPTGDLLIINLLYGNRDILLDNLENKFDFTEDKHRSLAILTPDTVIPRDEEKLKQVSLHSTRESLVTYAQENSLVNMEYLMIVLASTLVITLGLIMDNVAVIIGGMVIAPVLGPIMALTIGIVLGDYQLIRRGMWAEIMAVVLAVLISFLLTQIIPGVEITKSLETRMYPTLADLFIALGSGAAAAYTLIKGKQPLGLVGVMVAAALMPVMCTVGVGLALGNRQMVLGALLLLGGNYLGLLLANMLVFYYEGLRPQIWYKHRAGKTIKKSLFLILIAVFLLGVPLTFMTVHQFYQEKPDEIVRNSIHQHFDTSWDYRIESINIRGKMVEVYIYARKELKKDKIQQVKDEVKDRLGEEYDFYFRIIPVIEENF
ncbi:MAG: TIGR00341 family protein [Bacillota bacterium]